MPMAEEEGVQLPMSLVVAEAEAVATVLLKLLAALQDLPDLLGSLGKTASPAQMDSPEEVEMLANLLILVMAELVFSALVSDAFS